jgi:oxalate---CoA ligase
MIQSIAATLKKHAVSFSDQIGILAPGRSALSYDRLWLQIVYVIESLNGMGLGRNDRVAIVLPDGPEMAVAFVAVASGATAAPLNPACLESELVFYLSDLSAKAVIVPSGGGVRARAAAQACGIPVIELSFDAKAAAGVFALSGKPAPSPARGGFAQDEDIALVLHTSGTTSRPKIVALTQRNLCSSTLNHRVTLAITHQDRCLNMMPLFHIHALVSAVLTSLTSRASVVCTQGFDAAMFFDCLEEFKPTWFTAAPALYQSLLAYLSSTRRHATPHSLRFLRSAAAPLDPMVLQKLERQFNVPLVESYGMTEAAAQIASNPLPPRERKAGSVGIASGPEAAVMDENGKLLPPGTTGEIVIRGANVIAGYENNAAANGSSFTHGWLRTGDQGFMDSDGYFFISGRLKEIINRGGEKISPREVDQVLLEHPGIAEVATFAVPHAGLGEDVVAAVVLRGNDSSNEREIRDFAAGRLSQQKVPSRILIVDQIPKSPTGKLQRNRLAEALKAKLKPAFTPPSNEMESALAGILTDVLNIEQVGVHDHFFSLGGDSLSATRVVIRIKDLMGLSVPLRLLFDCPTVAEMAQFICISQEVISQSSNGA